MPTSPELLLISAVLNEGDHITPAINGITADMFHQYPDEYEWIEKYCAAHRRAPSRAAFLQKFPGTRVIKAANDIVHFCQEVKESHAQAELLDSIQQAIDLADRGELRKAIKHLQTTSMQTEVQLEGVSTNDDIIEHWEADYEEAAARVQRTKDYGQSGIPTGFPTLDERTGGVQPGKFWVIAARLGEGKTWTLNRMATAALFGGFNVQYNALEMTRAEIAFRVHTFASSVYGKEVFKNMDLSQGRNFDIREYKEFLRGLKTSIKSAFRVADQTRGPITTSTMAAQFERHMSDIMFLDYITLVESDNPDMRVGITKLSQSIKNMAQRYQRGIVVAAQLNRAASDRRDLAGPENLAESDAIGRDADVIVTMRQLSKRVMAMKLAKHRDGKSGITFYAKFLVNTGEFSEITFNKAQDMMAEDKDEENSEEAIQKSSSVPGQRKSSGFEPTKKASPSTGRKLIVKKKTR